MHALLQLADNWPTPSQRTSNTQLDLLLRSLSAPRGIQVHMIAFGSPLSALLIDAECTDPALAVSHSPAIFLSIVAHMPHCSGT